MIIHIIAYINAITSIKYYIIKIDVNIIAPSKNAGACWTETCCFNKHDTVWLLYGSGFRVNVKVGGARRLCIIKLLQGTIGQRSV